MLLFNNDNSIRAYNNPKIRKHTEMLWDSSMKMESNAYTGHPKASFPLAESQINDDGKNCHPEQPVNTSSSLSSIRYPITHLIDEIYIPAVSLTFYRQTHCLKYKFLTPLNTSRRKIILVKQTNLSSLFFLFLILILHYCLLFILYMNISNIYLYCIYA